MVVREKLLNLISKCYIGVIMNGMQARVLIQSNYLQSVNSARIQTFVQHSKVQLQSSIHRLSNHLVFCIYGQFGKSSTFCHDQPASKSKSIQGSSAVRAPTNKSENRKVIGSNPTGYQTFILLFLLLVFLSDLYFRFVSDASLVMM